MKHRHDYILLLILLVCFLQLGEVCNAQHRTRQKVFTDWGGVGNELVIDISRGRLRIRKPVVRYVPVTFLVDGLRYPLDDNIIETNYKKHDIKHALTVKDDHLFYEGERVTLPRGVTIRGIWQAVLWNGWIICLGRTSQTDGTAKLMPPFFATELITFNAEQRSAKVKFIVSDPPSGTRLFILDPK